MGKKLNTVIFILAGTVVDLLLAAACVVILVALLYLCRGFIPQGALQFMLFAALIGGVMAGVLLYQRLAIWVIEKFNLEDKLDPIFKPRPPRKR